MQSNINPPGENLEPSIEHRRHLLHCLCMIVVAKLRIVNGASFFTLPSPSSRLLLLSFSVLSASTSISALVVEFYLALACQRLATRSASHPFRFRCESFQRHKSVSIAKFSTRPTSFRAVGVFLEWTRAGDAPYIGCKPPTFPGSPPILADIQRYVCAKSGREP